MSPVLASALLVFALRVVDISLYTMRIKMVVRGRKAWAFLFAFFQSFVFVIALRTVISDLGSWPKMLGYAAGFATGMVVGMAIEERLAVGYTHLRIISPILGSALVERLRSEGYGATEVLARGKDGCISLIHCSVLRKDAVPVADLVEGIDPGAFVTEEMVRPLQRGYWHRLGTKA